MSEKIDPGGFGDKHNGLFRSGENWPLNACVGRNGGPGDFACMARGYFEAGKRLIASLQANRRGVDLLVFPIVFNYRHGVEAALKHLGRQLPFLVDEEGQVATTHTLLDNWGKVRGLLERWASAMESEPDPAIEVVEQRLRELVEIDPSGECFRYPEARGGEPYLQETSCINLEVFGEQMDEVAVIFECWMTMAHHYRGLKMEAMADG